MSRFNYQRAMVDLGQCSDVDSLRAAVKTLYGILQDAGIGAKPQTTAEAAQVDANGNFTFPTSEPPRAWLRFELDGAFAAGVANAHVIDAGASGLDPNEPILVVDALNKYSAAIDGDVGYAQVMPAATGAMQNEVMVMPGVGAPIGTDNYTVKLDAGDKAEYMPAKFRDLFGEVGVPAYNAGTDALVYFEKVEGTPDRLFAYAATGAVAQADEKVKCSASDGTASYLGFKLLEGLTVGSFDGALHMPVNFETITVGSTEFLFGRVPKSAESGKTRVSSGDSLDYLDQQFTDTGSYTGSGQTLVSFDVSSGTAIRAYVVPDGLLKVNAADTLDYLEDQFTYETATAFDSALDWPVSSVTNTGKIQLYTRPKRTWWGVVEDVAGITALTGVQGGTLTPGQGTVRIYSSAGVRDASTTKTFKSWGPEAVVQWSTVRGEEEPDGTIWLKEAWCTKLEAS